MHYFRKRTHYLLQVLWQFKEKYVYILNFSILSELQFQ